MKSIKRDYFIVLDRESVSKDELMYKVNFFFLKSLRRKQKQSFSFISDPFFKGIVVLGLDFKEKMRPLKFDKIMEDGSLKPVDPKLFRQFLISENNKYIAFSSQASKEDIKPLEQILTNFQIKKSKIIKLTFCSSCLEERKFKILKKGIQIKSIKGQIICPKCALNTIINQAKTRGVIPSEKINPKLKNFFRHLILKFKDINKVLDAFKPNFDPSKNESATLYDIETRRPISQEYLNRKVDDLNIPKNLKKILHNLNITTLLPIQAISIEEGLLSNKENQLIMAPTSGGKTLVGEIAGVSKLLQTPQAKMLYLVPIVALANIREVEFTQKYKEINLNIVKKIGESLIDRDISKNLEDLKDADIIIATYEAIDYIFRSGNKDALGNIQTILIDEIQTLIDPDRGFLLDGLIARLKTIYHEAQYLYLSATIGEPKVLAKKLESQLIRYSNRPVPVERHLLLCQSERVKLDYIRKLVKSAFSSKSQYGYRGQSIIFTNARKKCESITKHLQDRGVFVKSYHSGLTSEERKQIEFEFQSQRIAGVVATAALAAGVDLPASQVIFESLAMGINWLTVADFEQMLGRAGRLKKHDLGKAYLLVQPEKIYSPKMEITEENIAIKLLNGKIRDFELEPNEDKSLTEILAFISTFPEGTSKTNLFSFYNHLINANYEIKSLLKKLKEKELIILDGFQSFSTTNLGRAIAKSFLTIEQSFDVIRELEKAEISIKEIVLNLKPLKNVYLSKSVVADLSKNVNMKYFSNNFFSNSVLSLMDANYVRKRKKFSEDFITLVLKWINDIFTCECQDNPYCECGRLNLEKIILDLRIKDRLSIEQIQNYLEENYQILIFKGDLIDYLENLIYSFESIKNIAEGITNLDLRYQKELKNVPEIVENIKG